MLVAIDNFSAWPDALFLHNPTTKKVIEFLKNYKSQYGIPKQIRSDPGTVVTSEEFKTFCRKFQMNHITSPVRDHRGNGKIERLIRTILERLRTNKNIILKRDNSALSESLYALKMRKTDGKLPFEILYGRKPNTVKSNIVDKNKVISEIDTGLKFTTSDFDEEQDSTIMVTERTRGSKLEGQFERNQGKQSRRPPTPLLSSRRWKKGSSLFQTGCGEDKAAEEKRETPKRRPSWAVRKMRGNGGAIGR